MADKITVTLLRPLNGAEVGTTAEYDKADADRLAKSGAVELPTARQSAKAETVVTASVPKAPNRKGK